jgi:flagellar hook-associated protein 3 FlgL
MQSRNSAIKNDIQRLTLELSSGQVADVRKAVGGNTAYLNDIDRNLRKLEAYDLATEEAGQFAMGVQNALSRISDLNAEFRNTLLVSSSSALGEASTNVLAQAKTTLDDMISALNTTVAGRSLFAGTATDTAPIASSEDLLASLKSSVAGAGSVDDVMAAAEAWFDSPAGFGASGYRGADDALTPFPLSDGETTTFSIRGDDPVLRKALMNFAIMALADDPALGLTPAQQSELLQRSIPGVIAADTPLIDLQAKTGFSQNRIEGFAARLSTERSTLEMARNDLLGINPYEAATELEQVQFQLQSLYTITSRMSQLSLVNFL